MLITGYSYLHLRRIDQRMVEVNTTIAIEIDEYQHSGYSIEDELARFNDLFITLGTFWAFIRFNPDI